MELVVHTFPKPCFVHAVPVYPEYSKMPAHYPVLMFLDLTPLPKAERRRMSHDLSIAVVEGRRWQTRPQVLDQSLSVDSIKLVSDLPVVGHGVLSGRAMDFFLIVTGASSSGASPKDNNPMFLCKNKQTLCKWTVILPHTSLRLSAEQSLLVPAVLHRARASVLSSRQR